MSINQTLKDLLEGNSLTDAIKDLLESDARLKDLYRKWTSEDTDDAYFTFLRAWVQSGEELEPFDIDAASRGAVDLKSMRVYLRQNYKHVTVSMGRVAGMVNPHIPFTLRIKGGKKDPERIQYFHYPDASYMRGLIKRMIGRPNVKDALLQRSKGYTIYPRPLSANYGPIYQELFEISQKMVRSIFSNRFF